MKQAIGVFLMCVAVVAVGLNTGVFVGLGIQVAQRPELTKPCVGISQHTCGALRYQGARELQKFENWIPQPGEQLWFGMSGAAKYTVTLTAVESGAPEVSVVGGTCAWEMNSDSDLQVLKCGQGSVPAMYLPKTNEMVLDVESYVVRVAHPR